MMRENNIFSLCALLLSSNLLERIALQQIHSSSNVRDLDQNTKDSRRNSKGTNLFSFEI